MRFFKQAKTARLFILGWDGSPLPLLQRLVAAGDLPNLARVFQGGSAITMSSSLPDVSAVAWTSINTGKNPGKHGIYGFVDRKPGSYSLDVMTAGHVRSKTIWELVSDAGRRAIAVNVPLSFPPQQINGIVISDFLAPALSKAVYPTRFIPYLQDIGYRIDTDPAVARESLDAFLEDFRITAEKRAEAILHLMQNEPWDLFMAVFMETDRLHHFLWQYMEENDPNYGPKFIEAYRLMDRLAGEIVNRLAPDDQLIILSDHGFTTLKQEVYINRWLEDEGFLVFEPGAERKQETISAQTRAYSMDPGRIYINLAGREPRGSVPPEEADSVVGELVAKLRGLQDPYTGECVLGHFYRAGEIYQGPEKGRAPDLLVMGNDGYDVKGMLDRDAVFGKGKLVGMHKYENATLFVRGHRFTQDHASVHDVLPTACSLMGIECPAGVDGKVVIHR
ncbi:MAG: alkaline phosphatase family protein [Chloroflexota bacterium]